MLRPILIVSLGNPGLIYAKTPHSAGHLVIEALRSEILKHKSSHTPWERGVGAAPQSMVTALRDQSETETQRHNDKKKRKRELMSTGPDMGTAVTDSDGEEMAPISPVYIPLFGHCVDRGRSDPISKSIFSWNRPKREKIYGSFSHPGRVTSPLLPAHVWSLFQSGVYMNTSGPEVWRAWSAWVNGLSTAYVNHRDFISLLSTDDEIAGSPQQTSLPPLPALVVLHDELQLEIGKFQVRKAELSTRGHNGLESIAGKTPAHMHASFLKDYIHTETQARTGRKQREESRKASAAAAAAAAAADLSDTSALEFQKLAKQQQRKERKANNTPAPLIHPPMMYRIGIGIGRPDTKDRDAVSKYVLGPLKSGQAAVFVQMAEEVAKVCRKISMGEM